ncbi:MAG: hypothetical protein M3404_02500 [Actinomycetota bacterium]|nr:hypothetical protein [Actinomycetota bacterium]
MSTDADRIESRGIAFELEDGREIHLRYSMRSLKRLEERFGTLDAMDRALGPSDNGNEEKPTIGPLCDFLHAGVVEDIALDDLLVNLEPAKLEQYMETLSAALDIAFPGRDKGKDQVPEVVDATASLGPGTGT